MMGGGEGMREKEEKEEGEKKNPDKIFPFFLGEKPGPLFRGSEGLREVTAHDAEFEAADFGETAHPVVAALAELDLDTLSPEQALVELRRLKRLGGS